MTHTARALRLLAGIAILALSGCATRTTANFDARLAGLVGRPEVEVITALGVPVRTYDVSSRRFLQYESRRLVGYPGSYPFAGYPYGRYGYGFYGGFGGFPPTIETRECDLTVMLNHGRMQGYTRHGNDCRALPPGVG